MSITEIDIYKLYKEAGKKENEKQKYQLMFVMKIKLANVLMRVSLCLFLCFVFCFK